MIRKIRNGFRNDIKENCSAQISFADISLIATNCEQYNDAESELTKDTRVGGFYTKGSKAKVKSFYISSK